MKKFQTIYSTIIKENSDQSQDVESTLAKFFEGIPSWISNSFLKIGVINGHRDLNQTYDYFNDFVKDNIMKKSNDQLLEKTVQACKQARNFLKDLV